MSFDITPLLDGWHYRPGEISVRKFTTKEGTEKIQLRVDLGLLQMSAQGRPDGKRPCGHESLLQHHQARLEKYKTEHDSSDDGFVLRADDCSKLLQELIQYHHRYICLFQLRDFEGVIRDTNRNLQVFEFVADYAASEEMAWSIQQFGPQLLMMMTRARGSLALEKKDIPAAIEAVFQGIDSIRQFYRDFSKNEAAEQSGEIQSLENWVKELQDKAASGEPRRDLSPREKLESAINDAVQREDYESAARFRDTLRNLNTSSDT